MNLSDSANLPLVSVVMPAYKGVYLDEALSSVLNQTYRPLQLVICDDSVTPEVEEIVDAFRARADFEIIYRRNESRLWETRSTARAVALADGTYVKFLHDDDVLEPECIELLVVAIESESRVALVSSRRIRIDEEGNPLPDILATLYPFREDVVIRGPDLVSFLADHTLNFIGEPSTVLCRRADLLELGDQLSVLDGKRITWIADLALYVKLLRLGDLAMLQKPLTQFRVSKQQFSQIGRDNAGIGEKAHAEFRQAIRDLGWYDPACSRKVAVAPITRVSSRVFKPVDLLNAIHAAANHTGVSTSRWIGARHPDPIQERLIEQRLAEFAGGPQISILIIDRNGDGAGVKRTLASLNSLHIFNNYNVVVVTADNALDVAQDCARVSYSQGDLSGTLNTTISSLRSDWILMVGAGDEFTASGLMMIALELCGAPALHAIYADEIMRDSEGDVGLALRPDMNLDLLLSFPAGMAGHWLFHRETLSSLGGFDGHYPQALEFDLLLRLIDQFGIAGFGHVSEPLLISDAQPLRDNADEREAIEKHLRNRGYIKPEVRSGLPGRYHIDYGHELQPLVSIMLLVTDRLPQVQRCVETLLEHTSYPFYEVMLIDHGSREPETLRWLSAMAEMGAPRVRLLGFDAQLNRCVVRNRASEEAEGQLLLWLGAGAAIIQNDWLEQLLNHALRPEIGAVGAKILAADGTVRHAGLVLGLQGPAGRAFEGATADSAGYMQRLQIDQNYSAVSEECLMVRRDLFAEAGGFEEDPVFDPWADVDLCLRLRQAGYLNVWASRAQLLVDIKACTTSSEHDDAMYGRWLGSLSSDPAYNPGFSLQTEKAFQLAPPQIAWRPLNSWRPLPVVLGHPADAFGCGHYRLIQPFLALKDSGLIDGCLTPEMYPMPELDRFCPDVLILQRPVTEIRLDGLKRASSFSRAFKIYELDDYLPNLPMKSAHRAHMPRDIVKSLRKGLGLVDRFVVSTEPLAEAFAEFHPDIRVVENRLPAGWWRGLRSARRTSERPRVGWAGGASHTGDLELIADVVRGLAGEVDWVFFGMCPESLRPYVKEFHPGVAIDQYPAKLASLSLDLALAPVEQNLFNECKSNLRLLEYGACALPVICSDVRCYHGNLPVTRVKNRYKDWMEAIRMHLADRDASEAMGVALQGEVLANWMLEGSNLDVWREAWLPG